MRWVQQQPVSHAAGEDPVCPITRRVRPGGVEHTIHIDQDQRPVRLHSSTVRCGLRNDSTIASIMYAHGTQMTGWSNVVRGARCEVFPAFTPPQR